jgi:hypothetical protein
MDKFTSAEGAGMGLSVVWVGVRTEAPAEVHARLGVVETGMKGGRYDFETAGQMQESGWYILTGKRCNNRLVSDKVLKVLSADTSVVACSVEEHVNYTSAAFWRNGAGIWRVQHRGDIDVTDLEVDGSPPDNFEEIRARYTALQEATCGEGAGRDYMNSIPNELAHTLVGFSYDNSTYGADVEMVDLEIDWTSTLSPGAAFTGEPMCLWPPRDTFRDLRPEKGSVLRPSWYFW